MNVFLFQPQFEPLILSGVKDQTIRGRRRDNRPRARVGQELSLRVWSGLPYRSKQREFARGVVVFVIPVRIQERHPVFCRTDVPGKNGVLVPRLVARRDGFADWRAMKEWFRSVHGLPFEGELVHWRLTGRSDED